MFPKHQLCSIYTLTKKKDLKKISLKFFLSVISSSLMLVLIISGFSSFYETWLGFKYPNAGKNGFRSPWNFGTVKLILLPIKLILFFKGSFFRKKHNPLVLCLQLNYCCWLIRWSDVIMKFIYMDLGSIKGIYESHILFVFKLFLTVLFFSH